MTPEGHELLQQVWRAQGAKAYGVCAPAMHLAEAAHEGQQRKSGQAYIFHPVAVARMLWEDYADPQLVAAALLHDTVEDCEDVTMERIYADFGDEVGFLVDAVTKDRKGFHGRGEVFADKIERLLWAGMQDVRVILLKLADREHNISTIDYLREDKQVRMAFETQAIFEPLAGIVEWGAPSTPAAATALLADYCAAQGIASPMALKEHLLAQSFESLDDKLFSMVYRDVSSIVWEVSDYPTYCQLTERYPRNISIVSLQEGEGSFAAQFLWRSGGMLENARLGIGSYYAHIDSAS